MTTRDTAKSEVPMAAAESRHGALRPWGATRRRCGYTACTWPGPGRTPTTSTRSTPSATSAPYASAWATFRRRSAFSWPPWRCAIAPATGMPRPRCATTSGSPIAVWAVWWRPSRSTSWPGSCRSVRGSDTSRRLRSTNSAAPCWRRGGVARRPRCTRRRCGWPPGSRTRTSRVERLAGLAEHFARVDPAEARRHWERALAIFRRMGVPERFEAERRLAELTGATVVAER